MIWCSDANESNIHFTSFCEEDADLYHKIKKCAFGGRSIIFKRYAKVDETCIRNNESIKCKSIHRFDCNSLYLYALGDTLPILFPIRRFEETNFSPQVSWKNLEMYMWMNWLMNSNDGLFIQHKLNSGKEFPVGPYRLDGYSTTGNRRSAFEFNGCWTPAHNLEECTFERNPNMSREVRIFMPNEMRLPKSANSTLGPRELS